MAIRIKEDLIDGSSMLIDFDGASAVRHFQISGLAPLPASSVLYRAYNAVDAVTGRGVAKVGDGHPDIPEMLCRSVQIDNFLESKSIVRAASRYQSLEAVTVRLNGNLMRETTRMDAAGELMKVGYKPKAAPTFYPEKTQGFWSVAEAEVLRPGDVLEFERAEKNPTIGIDMQALEGATNDRKWQGQPAYSWMCVGVSASTTVLWKKRPFWMRRYAFQYKYFASGGFSQDHRAFTFFNDFQTGKIPLDVDPTVGIKANMTSGNGWKLRDMQPVINFDVFKLPEVLA